jgi:hypothetical protein
MWGCSDWFSAAPNFVDDSVLHNDLRAAQDFRPIVPNSDVNRRLHTHVLNLSAKLHLLNLLKLEDNLLNLLAPIVFLLFQALAEFLCLRSTLLESLLQHDFTLLLDLLNLSVQTVHLSAMFSNQLLFGLFRQDELHGNRLSNR